MTKNVSTIYVFLNNPQYN